MKKILGVLVEIKQDLFNGENLDIYVTILLCFVFAFLGITDVADYKIISAGILATLSLLVTSLLANRRIIKRLEQVYILSNSLTLREIPQDALREPLRNSKTISIVGVSFFRFIPTFHMDIEHALSKGCLLKIIMVDPQSSAIEMAAYRSASRTPIETEKQRVKLTIEFIARMIERVPDAKVEIRLLDFLPPFGITILHPISDADLPYCHARVLGFRTSTLNSPVIKPHPIKDSIWFDFFVEQFQNMWNLSKAVDISKKYLQNQKINPSLNRRYKQNNLSIPIIFYHQKR